MSKHYLGTHTLGGRLLSYWLVLIGFGLDSAVGTCVSSLLCIALSGGALLALGRFGLLLVLLFFTVGGGRVVVLDGDLGLLLAGLCGGLLRCRLSLGLVLDARRTAGLSGGHVGGGGGFAGHVVEDVGDGKQREELKEGVEACTRPFGV